MKVWDRAGIKLATPGCAFRLASVARHVTDCATWLGVLLLWVICYNIYLERFQFTNLLSLVGKHHLVFILNGRQKWLVCLEIFYQVFKNLPVGLKQCITVNVLKFRTQIAFQKGLDKQCRPISNCF